MRVQAPTACHLAKLDAAFSLLKALLQRNKRLLNLSRVGTEHVGEGQNAHRFVGYEQHRLDGTGKPLLAGQLGHCHRDGSIVPFFGSESIVFAFRRSVQVGLGRSRIAFDPDNRFACRGRLALGQNAQPSFGHDQLAFRNAQSIRSVHRGLDRNIDSAVHRGALAESVHRRFHNIALVHQRTSCAESNSSLSICSSLLPST